MSAQTVKSIVAAVPSTAGNKNREETPRWEHPRGYKEHFQHTCNSSHVCQINQIYEHSFFFFSFTEKLYANLIIVQLDGGKEEGAERICSCCQHNNETCLTRGSHFSLKDTTQEKTYMCRSFRRRRFWRLLWPVNYSADKL